MSSVHTCRRCGTKQEAVSCGDCETAVCAICNDRCRRCDHRLCDKHLERSVSRGGICGVCLEARREYLRQGQEVFGDHLDQAEGAGDVELARVLKTAFNILEDLVQWDALLETRRIDIEMLPDVRADALTRQLKELQREEVALHAARKAAEDTAASKSQFVAHMSHEIRTPMNAVIAMADLLSETQLDEQQRKYLSAVQRSGEHLVRIIGDTLDYSKLEAGRFSVETVLLDLELIVAEVVEILAPQATKKNLPVIMRYSPDACRKVLGDPVRIRQVLINLIGNAIKFTHTGNVLVCVSQLGVAENRAVLRITVLDTGIGIPEDKYSTVFGQYNQVGENMSREYGGTGLGLAISNRLVRLMGGKISLSSDEGKGSRFRVTLTMQLAEDSGGTTNVEALSGQRILIADPSMPSAEILALQAQHFGNRVTVTSEHERVMDVLITAHEEKDPFDAVWLHHIPKYLDAATLGGAIGVSELLPKTMLVCFASAGMEENSSLFEELGFSNYFYGPCLLNDIREGLASSLPSFSVISSEKMVALGNAAPLVGIDDRLDEPIPELSGYRVLVVEDRPVNQEVAVAIFESLGCELTIAQNGEEAAKHYECGEYDIVFMDCQMPVMDGYEAARRIRRLEPDGSHMPIIAMTAHVADGYREKCIQAGMDDYIPKPVSRNVIAGVMEHWLKPKERVLPSIAAFLEAGHSSPDSELEEKDPVIDRKRALHTLGGKWKTLQRVTNVFLEKVPEEVVALEEALRAGHAEEVERLAHSIKSAAAALGGDRVWKIAEQLEAAGRQADWPRAHELHTAFAREFSSLIRELNEVEWSDAG